MSSRTADSASEVVSPVRIDGRTARAERTRKAIVEALLDLTTEGVLKPTAERIVERAGVSLRALWTNFKDMETLYAAAGERLIELQAAEYRPVPMDLPLERRIEEFCRQRGRMLEIMAPAARASQLRLPFSPHVRQYRANLNARLREEIATLFHAELDGDANRREQLLNALLVASTWNAWSMMRDDFSLPADEAVDLMRRTVTALLRSAA